MTRKFQTGHMAVWLEFFGQEISMNGQRIGGKFFWNEGEKTGQGTKFC